MKESNHRELPRVVVVNKFHYRRGGDCIYTLNLERLLHAEGHLVASFAMRHPLNEPTGEDVYFPPEVRFGGGPGDKLRAARRMLGLDDATARFDALLRDYRPDVVHLNNVHSYLSPALALAARRRGVRVVWTLHDYKLLCPSYSRLAGGRPCDRCHGSRGLTCVLATRCMKGSAAASLMAWVEALRWRRSTLLRSVDAFICPSQFMAREMERAGWPADRLHTLNNFIAAAGNDAAAAADGPRKGYCCYVGRMSEEKGVRTLLEAATMTQRELRLAGDGPLLEELRSKYSRWPQITFLGRLDGAGVARLLAEAACSVLPSEWYENNPLGVIESLCAGTPVVGAAIGGIPELIDESPAAPAAANGLTCPPGDPRALAAAIDAAACGPWDHRAIRAAALARFSPTSYYSKLLKIYQPA